MRADVSLTDTTSVVWGVFGDEGMLDGAMTHAQAAAELARYDPRDAEWLVVARECQEHPEQRAQACEECDAQDEDGGDEG